jgi:hypothetical protein
MEKGQEEVTPVYLRSTEHVWIPALQLKVHPCGTKATVAIPTYNNENEMLHCAKSSESSKYHNNQIISLKEYPNHVLPMQNVDTSGNVYEYMDMVDLPFMHEVGNSMLEIFHFSEFL